MEPLKKSGAVLVRAMRTALTKTPQNIVNLPQLTSRFNYSSIPGVPAWVDFFQVVSDRPSILANLVLCHLQHLPPKVLRCALVTSLLLLFLCLLLERHPAERAKTHACLLPMGGFHGVHPSPGWNVTTRDTSNAKSSWDVSSS